MVKLLDGPRKEARSRGTLALVGWVGTGVGVLLFGAGVGSIILGGIVGVIGSVISVGLTWRWLKYRGEWGLRF
jgi:hypothetical protein